MNSTTATPNLTAMIIENAEELLVTSHIYDWLKKHAEEIKSYHLQGGFSVADKF